MKIEEQKKAFEEYLKNEFGDGDKVVWYDGNPVAGIHLMLWKTWQASVNREGYKLVPTKANDYMKCCIRDLDPDIEEYANMSKNDWENLCSDIYEEMLRACDDN